VGSNVLAGVARQFNSLLLPRVGVRFGLTSLLLLAGAGSVHDAAALNETRTLSFHHTHSNEDITVTFKRDGRYDEDALKQLNHYLRDWRSQDQTTMDRHLFDILWEVYRDVDGKKPIQIISSYRSPATNAMLRRRSSGVARFSQHMLGHAMDFFIPDVPLEQIRYAGLRQQRGGVGFYPTSGSPFVHLDTGSIRHWPRMTREQLVKVFPDSRTVHVPTDGTPLKGYELARADIEKRDGDDKAMTKSSPSLWTRLFNKGKSNDEEDEGSAPAVSEKTIGDKAAPVGVMAAAAPAKSTDTKSTDTVPMPRSKPSAIATLQLASADAQIVQPRRLKQPKRNRKPRPTSSMPAVSGATPPPRRSRQRPRRWPPLAPVARFPPPTRNRPPASPTHWPMRRQPIHRLTARTSLQRPRRFPAAPGRHRFPATQWPSPTSPQWSPRDRRDRAA